MMKSNAFFLAGLTLIVGAATTDARQTPSTPPPTTAAAEVMQCAQAQMVVDALLWRANARVEAARLTNNAAEMRAAIDELQATLRDVRAQLAPCANVQPATDPHIGHPPSVQPAPAAAPGTPAMNPGSARPAPAAIAPGAKPPTGGIDPHAGHTMPTATTPSAAPTAKPPAQITKPTTTAKPAAPDAHAGHTPATPSAGSQPAAASPKLPAPATKPAATTKPAAADPHAGHTMPAAPSKPAAPANKPPASKPPAADAHAGHDMSTPAAPENGTTTQATDPVCGLKVDLATAPSTKHQGQTHYFCSEQHQQLFQKNPAKFLPKQP